VLTSLVGVIILLGGLIFFHELGHYTVAKLFGVKVEVFSLGFGKKLFKKQIGETEYTISLFPLGGYVKLMGDDPYKGVPAGEAERAFSTQKLYKRFLIVAAGPISNLLLAYVLFMIVYWAGQPMVATRIGAVDYKSPAWEAGFRAKDRITEVNGQAVTAWNEMEDMLKPRLGEKIDVLVERGNTSLKIPVTIEKVRAKNPYGEDEEVGGIKGISPNPAASAVGISNPKSLAYVAGLRTGDQILKIGTQTVQTQEEINDALASQWVAGSPMTFTFKRKASLEAKEGTEQSVSIPLPKLPANIHPLYGRAEALGIYPTELFVRQVSPGTPAEKGGMKAGDRIVRVGKEDIYDFEKVVDLVQVKGAGGESVDLTVERDGESIQMSLKPVHTTMEDPLTRQTIKKYLVGFAPTIILQEAELTALKIRNPVKLVTHAVSETNVLAKRMLVSLWKLMFGEISAKNLGGPLLIASVAGKSLDAGIIPFLQMMALISINLFLLNLFPVPILDGGHLLFFAIEAVKGKPVSIRTMEIANQVGMAFILVLVAVTFYNDISRMIQH
jgi:regulator of sigma E protease